MTNGQLIKKILVPTDGSDLSLRAAGYAAKLAKCTGAEVTILNVAEVTGITQFVSYSMQSSDNLGRDMHETGVDIIEKTKKLFLEADVPVHNKIIEGFAPEAIISEARDGGYDLIVMGSRGAGMGLLRRIVFGLGSVAERVVSSAPCPVLIVRE